MLLKILAALVLLASLVVFGFFFGIYLRLFDVHEVNEKMRLYNLPVFGEYFVKPPEIKPAAPPEEPPPEGEIAGADKEKDKEKEQEKDKDKEKAKQEADTAKKAEEQKKTEEEPKKPALTEAEIEKKRKAEQAAEKKRVTHLARVYSEMKPKDAADIMDGLNDDITIAILQRMDVATTAKIMAEFDPDKSARLTRAMYTGERPAITSPGEGASLRPAETEDSEL